MTRTKIICTIGPSVSSYEKIVELIGAGMNVARINFSHGTHAEHAEVIAQLKKARERLKTPLAIMVDTKGPEIRIGKVHGNGWAVKAGETIHIVACKKNDADIEIVPPEVLSAMKKGMKLLFDDGYIQGQVVRKIARGVQVEMLNEGILKSHKSITLPAAQAQLPAMTVQDKKDLEFACLQEVDWIAASFIRSERHVQDIRRFLKNKGGSSILVMAKIESVEGVESFDSILEVADGIMVARGDLGVELPLEEVPSLQKMMIYKACEFSKPVVTATQMLESMIHNPRPTRAEVSDVANAIYDSSSAVMLSGETAVGKYPIETVKMMRKVIEQTELDFEYRHYYEENMPYGFSSVSNAIAAASVQTAYTAKAKAIFVFTASGATARLISRFRPEMPVIALTSNEKHYHQLALEWGIIPFKIPPGLHLQEAMEQTMWFAIEHQLVQKGDLVVAVTGTPFLNCGTTNTLIVEKVG